MASAIIRDALPAAAYRKKIITFCKRQKDSKLWNRFHITSTMDQADAERLNVELISLFPDKEFQLEIEKSRV